jgi:HAD superfamily phosphoserine phosphatase-like hydrolase
MCSDYAKDELPKLIKSGFLEYITRLREQNKNFEVVIVSASFESYLKYWCKDMEFDLLATGIEVSNEVITGKFATKNCYGSEKVKRIKEKYNLSHYKTVYVFGDTKGDKPMLQLGDKCYYRYFK